MMKFSKYQGCGNDFIIINGLEQNLDGIDVFKLAEAVCDRHFGVGADGLLIVHKSEVADVRMQVINSDGSEPEMCGNGVRCFAAYLHDSGFTKKDVISVETGAGVKIADLILRDNKVTAVEVDMGEPIIIASMIPIRSESSRTFMRKEFVVADRTFPITAVSMGNPHAVSFLDDIDFDFERYGAILEVDEHFPQKTNVEFCKIFSPDKVAVKVWERGAGATLACGTGACAVVVAGNLEGKLTRNVRVGLPGGTLEVEWQDDNHVILRGPALKVFEGELPVELYRRS